MDDIVSTRVCQHLRASGLKKTECARLASLTQKWVRDSGAKWAADRWKDLANYAHQRLTGSNPSIPIGWATRTNTRGRKILKDGFLHRNLEFGLKGYSLETLRRMEAICRIPTVITADLNRPNRRSIDKIVDSITQPFSGKVMSLPDDTITAFVDWLEEYLPWELRSHRIFGDENEFVSRWMKFRDCIPLAATPPSEKRSPFLVWDKVNGTVKQLTGNRSNLEVISPTLLAYSRKFQSIYIKYPEQISTCLAGSTSFSPYFMAEEYTMQEPPVGRISLLNKDGSAKIRAIASASYDLQVCLSPMKQALQVFIETNPCSSVFDQDEGREFAVKALARGDVVFGYDQSSFTDRFPYQLQRQVAVELERRGLGITKADIALLDYAVQGTWTCNQIEETASFTYAVGQPMGLNPSFFLATLGHIAVCFQGARNLGDVSILKDSVRIVGDDIVITNKDLAAQYHMLMADRLGVTINLDKSMNSDRVTTFCGKLITADGVVPSTKVKQELDKMAVKDKLSFYGIKAMPYFESDLRRTANYAILPQPFGGGLKPPSISYSKWIQSIDREKAQRIVLRDELETFIGPPSSTKHIASAMEALWAWRNRNDCSLALEFSMRGEADIPLYDEDRIQSLRTDSNDMFCPYLACFMRNKLKKAENSRKERSLNELRAGLSLPDNSTTDVADKINTFANIVDQSTRISLRDRHDAENLDEISSRYFNCHGYISKNEVEPLPENYPHYKSDGSVVTTSENKEFSKCQTTKQPPQRAQRRHRR